MSFVADRLHDLTRRIKFYFFFQATWDWFECFVQLKALENASQARQEKDVETSKTLETLSEGIKGLKNDQETVLETLEGLSAYNKQLNIKELPKRLAVLETQMQALQQERQQMPNWVKKQANMVWCKSYLQSFGWLPFL